MNDVFVTGYGIFTAHGFGTDALRDGVFAGEHAFGPVDRFDTTPFRGKHAAAFPGEAPGQLAALRRVSEAALEMAGAGSDKAGVFVGTQGDHLPVQRFWRDGETAGVDHSVPARLAELLAQELAQTGPRIAFVNACVASANAILHAARLIQRGKLDVAVCAGAYLVERESFANFDSGRAFAKDGRIRPFSGTRSGLLLGDGAAALVLESADRVRARGGEPLARVAGWGMASDAYHVCQPDPEGKGLTAAIEGALRRSGKAPSDIGYINAHGTGTKINDSTETVALHKVLGSAAPSIPISSTKSTTGHMLEGAGAVEAVISLLALRDGVLPPTAGYDVADPACDLDWIPNAPREQSVRTVLSVNAAFGGLNTAILLERP
ncbi:3-oxoacyl-[acyl-carrier-protein] synthase 2 [Lentzea sp. NBRC 105346]|uniref:beta-ketoacyl-[acyl-carrier-protein] synthase family protein n=1 Tax=Lentzea sp. NBRC 105346 TaxID=3032205 RepID=UPI0024A198E7|nr:beta-ketoacyl-[acyl-carrier-protein] synthase family protein [Lentzea sp. NBRC 105346]GLZ32248.1 3-oxoacyl-[acyl-carrier-protein] synthase 2 [Lentzea sp. NBRC 105346]